MSRRKVGMVRVQEGEQKVPKRLFRDFALRIKNLRFKIFSMQAIAYILYSEKLDRFYIGYSLDFEQRLYIHNSSENEKWTKNDQPWILYLLIPCTSKKQAMRIEHDLKKIKQHHPSTKQIHMPYFLKLALAFA
jgi:putative endonuclease